MPGYLRIHLRFVNLRTRPNLRFRAPFRALFRVPEAVFGLAALDRPLAARRGLPLAGAGRLGPLRPAARRPTGRPRAPRLRPATAFLRGAGLSESSRAMALVTSS